MLRQPPSCCHGPLGHHLGWLRWLLWLFMAMVLLLAAGMTHTAAAAEDQATVDALPPAFTQHFQPYLEFMATRDRSPSSQGLLDVAAFIAEELAELGLQVNRHEYPVLAPQYTDHGLTFADGTQVTLHPLAPNGPVLSSPGADGFTGPVQWAGDGSADAMSGLTWDESIAVMELRQGTDWLQPFALGAQAVILAPAQHEALHPWDLPHLPLPADLPRFTVSPEDGQLLQRLLLGDAFSPVAGVAGTVTGTGRWQEAPLPHTAAVIPGSDPVLASETVILHAEMDRSAYLGGQLQAAGEATSAAFLLGLAHQLAAEPPSRTTVLSFGSGRSQAFASLRHWLAEDERAQEPLLFIGIDLGDGGTGLAANVRDDSRAAAVLHELGLDAIDTSDLPGADREQALGHATPLAADVVQWRGIASITLTTTGDRRQLGGPLDRHRHLDAGVLETRAREAVQLLSQLMERPWLPGGEALTTITACLDRTALSGENAPPDGSWWTAGIFPSYLHQLPLAQPLDGNGCVGYVGLAREWDYSSNANAPANSVETVAYRLEDGGLITASQTERRNAWHSRSPLSQYEVPLAAGLIITLTGWPEPTPPGLNPGILGHGRRLPGLSSLSSEGIRDAATGRSIPDALFERLGPVATLMAPPGREVILHRSPIYGSAPQVGAPTPLLEPKLVLSVLSPDGSSLRLNARLTAIEHLHKESASLLERLLTSGGRHTHLEGLLQMAARERNAAVEALERGHLTSYYERLWEAHRDLADAHDGLLVVQRDSLVSLVAYLVLALVAAAALGHFLAVGRPQKQRGLLAVALFALLYTAVRQLHPGYGMVDLSPETATAGVVGAVLGVLGLVWLTRRLELLIARRRRRLGERPDIDRYSLFLTSISVGLSQLARRRARSILTALSLMVFVFAFISIGALTPSFELQPQHVGSDPAYQGVLVRAEDHAFLASRVPEDMAQTLPNVPEPIPIRWAQAPFLRPPGGDWGDRGDPPFHPRHVVQADGERVTFRAVTTAPIAYGRLLGTDQALLAGSWPEPGAHQVMMPLSLAGQLSAEPEQLVGTQLSMFYEFPLPSGLDDWAVESSHHRDVELAAIFDDTLWDLGVGLDGLPLAPPRMGSQRQLMVSPEIAADFAAGVVAWAAATGGPPSQEDVRQLATALPYAVYAGADDLRYAMGTARPTVMRLAAPMGILGFIGLLMMANTMLGAVFERRREFSILNVVGLAPHHVRTLVLTEGAVLGVVAVVLGWTLVMLTGGIIRATAWETELALNLSSFLLVLLLVGMIAATAAAAAIPAQMAARGVAPAGRDAMIPASGDTFALELPFSVEARDVPAVWAYLWPLFERGGSNAKTFNPLHVTWRQAAEAGETDALEAEIQLLPRDVGVNQTVYLSTVPADQGLSRQSRQLHLRLDRTSGTNDDWRRLNVAFLSELRRQLLAWDVIEGDDRQSYRTEAQQLRAAGASTPA